MLQRIQTIWFLLASLCAFLTLQISFYTGVKDGIPQVILNGQYSILLTIVTAFTGILGIICLFNYKNRKQQLQLAFVAMLFQVGTLALYFVEINKFTTGTFSLGSVVSFSVIIFFILGVLGVRKDQKLIKSLDRLR